MKTGAERFEESEEREVCYKIVPSREVRSYTNEVSLIRLPKYDLNKVDSNQHANTEGRELMAPQSKNKELQL